MTAARPVLVAVDGTPGSAGALRFASVEAELRRAPLRLVHVAADGVGRQVLSEAERSLRRAHPDVSVSTVLSTGARAAAIEEAAAEAQLVVLGRDTRRNLAAAADTVTAAVAARVDCPAAVVPSHWTGGHPRGSVVAGIQLGADAGELLAHALEAAAVRSARLVLVAAHAGADRWEADGDRLLDELVAAGEAGSLDVLIERRLVQGRAAVVLLREAQGADLLLLGRPDRGGPRPHLGGLTHAVLRATDTPVELVPSGRPPTHEPLSDAAGAASPRASTA